VNAGPLPLRLACCRSHAHIKPLLYLFFSAITLNPQRPCSSSEPARGATPEHERQESSSSDDDNHDGICTCGSCLGGIISPRSIKIIDVCFTSLIDLWTANNANAIQPGGPAVQYAYHPNAACTKVLPPPLAKRLEAETDLRQAHLDAFIAIRDGLSAGIMPEQKFKSFPQTQRSPQVS
jgi:hypothetical protein